MAEGGYKVSITTQSSDRKESETPDVKKKKKKNVVHGVQKKWQRMSKSKSPSDITSGGNDQTASPGGDGDYGDEHQENPQTWADHVPIENASSPPPQPQLNPPAHHYKDGIQQRTQLSQLLHVQGQLKPLAETGVYNSLDLTYNQTQSGVEEGAKASPYNSLNEKEQHFEQLKRKDEEIKDLNGRILKLEIDKRAIADELTEMQKKLEIPSHNVIVSQVDEINKAHRDLEAKQRELERKHKDFVVLTEQNEELKERLLRIEIDRQSSIVVQNNPPKPQRLLDQSNELRQLEERCRHLQTHNGKLTVQLKQQQQQHGEQSKQQKELITELSQKIEELSVENKKLAIQISQLQSKVKTSCKFEEEQDDIKKIKQEVTDAANELQKMETILKTKEVDLRLFREDNERKANFIDYHLNVLKQKEEENEKLKITIAELEEAKGEHLGSLTDELTQKEAKIIELRDRLEEKRKEINAMKEVLATKDQELFDISQQLEETKTQLVNKSQLVFDLKQQLKKTIIQMQDDNAIVNAKHLMIVELTEQLELAKVEAVGFKEDFEQERRDREKIHAELTNQLTTSQGVVRDLQQKLIQAIHDKEHETQALKIAQQTHYKEIEILQNQISALQEQKSTLQEIASKLTEEEDKVKNMEEEKVVLTSQVNTYIRQCEELKKNFEEKVETLEEEKLVLTSQVKGYSRQCEELKKTMVQLQEKSMTLEEQVYHKERIATEVEELKTQVKNAELRAQGALDSKAHLLLAFQQEQKKIAELEGALSKLSSANKDLQLLDEENKKKFDHFLNVLKKRAEEVKNVKATESQLRTELKEAMTLQDEYQQSNIHLVQQMEELQKDKQFIEQQIQESQQQLQESQRQLEESSRIVHIQDQHLEELRSQKEQPQWVVDREEVTMTEEVLGGGSYGKVEVAVFRGLRVAAKSLHGLIMSDYTRELFFREMDIASKVRHPNLVQFIGATTVGTPIILIEIMATSLYKELQKNASLRRSQILSISKDVASALNYLHLMKPHPIIHRDVSSPNVLLEPSVGDSYKAKVADYGAANLQPRSRTQMPGNSAYASPECYSPYNHTPAIDVYSYSVLLIEMTLHCPPAMSVEEREQQARRVSWPSMASLIKRCLNRDHSLRPTMRQILDNLTILKV